MTCPLSHARRCRHRSRFLCRIAGYKSPWHQRIRSLNAVSQIRRTYGVKRISITKRTQFALPVHSSRIWSSCWQRPECWCSVPQLGCTFSHRIDGFCVKSLLLFVYSVVCEIFVRLRRPMALIALSSGLWGQNARTNVVIIVRRGCANGRIRWRLPYHRIRLSAGRELSVSWILTSVATEFLHNAAVRNVCRE